MKLTIKSPVKADGYTYKFVFIEDKLPCYTEIPMVLVTKELKGNGLYVPDALEAFITYYRDKITIICLN